MIQLWVLFTSASTSTPLTVTEWSYCLFVRKTQIFGAIWHLSVCLFFAHFNFNSQQQPNPAAPKVETAGMMTTDDHHTIIMFGRDTAEQTEDDGHRVIARGGLNSVCFDESFERILECGFRMWKVWFNFSRNRSERPEGEGE